MKSTDPTWPSLADFALFGASPEERELVERDPDARRELEALELLCGEIAASEIEARGVRALPPALKEALLERAIAPVSIDPRPKADVRALPPRRDRARWAGWLLAAAAIVLLVVAWRRKPDEREVARPTPSAERAALAALPDAARLPWTATKDPAATGAGGDVVWHPGKQVGYMRFTGLAPNDPRVSQYQLWIFDAERDERYPVDGGVFDVGPSGEVVVPIQAKLAVRKAKLFAITVEKPGGVVVSGRERIVLTAAPPG